MYVGVYVCVCVGVYRQIECEMHKTDAHNIYEYMMRCTLICWANRLTVKVSDNQCSEGFDMIISNEL